MRVPAPHVGSATSQDSIGHAEQGPAEALTYRQQSKLHQVKALQDLRTNLKDDGARVDAARAHPESASLKKHDEIKQHAHAVVADMRALIADMETLCHGTKRSFDETKALLARTPLPFYDLPDDFAFLEQKSRDTLRDPRKRDLPDHLQDLLPDRHAAQASKVGHAHKTRHTARAANPMTAAGAGEVVAIAQWPFTIGSSVRTDTRTASTIAGHVDSLVNIPPLGSLRSLTSHVSAIAAASEPAKPISTLMQPVSHIATTLSTAPLLFSLYDVAQAYDHGCACCNTAVEIAEQRERQLTLMASSSHPVSKGVQLGSKFVTAGKLAFESVKKAKSDETLRSHTDTERLAEQLWASAQKAHSAPHPSSHRPMTAEALADDRCNAALFTIATLFGNGVAADGIRDAVTAVMSSEKSGVLHIRQLIAPDSWVVGKMREYTYAERDKQKARIESLSGGPKTNDAK